MGEFCSGFFVFIVPHAEGFVFGITYILVFLGLNKGNEKKNVELSLASSGRFYIKKD